MAKIKELKKLELTAAQVRLIYQRSGLTQPVFADEVGTTLKTLERYLRDGIPAPVPGRKGINPGVHRAILSKALQLGVIDTDEAHSAVFM